MERLSVDTGLTGLATDARLEMVRALLAGTLTVKHVAPAPRQSIIRTLTGAANTDLPLTDAQLADVQGCSVLNLQNQGTADLLVFNADNALSYVLPANSSVAGDFRLSDLKVRSVAPVKLAIWGGKDVS